MKIYFEGTLDEIKQEMTSFLGQEMKFYSPEDWKEARDSVVQPPQETKKATKKPKKAEPKASIRPEVEALRDKLEKDGKSRDVADTLKNHFKKRLVDMEEKELPAVLERFKLLDKIEPRDETTPTITLGDVQKQVYPIVSKTKTDPEAKEKATKIAKMLKEDYGVSNIKSLDSEHYASFLAKLEAL